VAKPKKVTLVFEMDDGSTVTVEANTPRSVTFDFQVNDPPVWANAVPFELLPTYYQTWQVKINTDLGFPYHNSLVPIVMTRTTPSVLDS